MVSILANNKREQNPFARPNAATHVKNNDNSNEMHLKQNQKKEKEKFEW